MEAKLANAETGRYLLGGYTQYASDLAAGHTNRSPTPFSIFAYRYPRNASPEPRIAAPGRRPRRVLLGLLLGAAGAVRYVPLCWATPKCQVPAL